jgi:hypothetical protein
MMELKQFIENNRLVGDALQLFFVLLLFLSLLFVRPRVVYIYDFDWLLADIRLTNGQECV